MIAKLATSDETSRRQAARFRTYEIEAGFYGHVAPNVAARVPSCWWSAYDPEEGTYAVLLEDLAPAEPGDQIRGCTVDDASAALAEMALIHATFWGDASLRRFGWLSRYEQVTAAKSGWSTGSVVTEFLERLGDRLTSEVTDLIGRFMPNLGRYDARAQNGAKTVAHGDFRADNLLFGHGRPCVVDWQTTALANGLADLSYFLSGSLPTAERRDHERALVREYHQRLIGQAVDLDWDGCWRDYRRYALVGLVMAVTAAPAVKRTARADELFAVMAERSGQHALDLDAEALL